VFTDYTLSCILDPELILECEMKVETALKFYKTQQLLATELGISQAAVSRWGDVMPEKQALKLDRITSGELKYDQALYTGPVQTGQEKNEAA
jgi:hypothetical protein